VDHRCGLIAFDKHFVLLTAGESRPFAFGVLYPGTVPLAAST
jgi:hypothetical protein